MSFRKLIIPLLIGLFNISLLVFPRDALGAAREGLLMWFQTILPSLLPFVVGTNILIKLGFLRFVGECIAPVTTRLFGVSGVGGIAFITGITSGYPIGAKTVGDLYRLGDIQPSEAQRLMAFCNNAGPLFIVGAVGIGMFGNAKAGYVLLLGHVFGAVAMGIAGRFIWGRSGDGVARRIKEIKSPPFGKVLGESVKNAMEAMVLVGGLIIFFHVVVRFMFNFFGLEGGYSGGFLGGLLEIAGGVKVISATGISTLSLALAAGVIGFGGFGVHAQALHFTADTGIKTSVYLLCKFLHGLLAAGFTALLWFVII
jgi:sporulation integral membrane protein YlbJ